MKKLFFLPVLIYTVWLMSACEAPSEDAFFSTVQRADATPFGKWQLVAYNKTTKVSEDVSLEIKSEADEEGNFIITGKSAINYYFTSATVNVEKRTISFRPIASTKMGGSDKLMKAEMEYYNLLTQVERYEMAANKSDLVLHLPTEKRKSLHFRKIP